MEKSLINRIFRRHESNREIYHDLMKFRVREVLIVATAYDAFILEKEGQLFEQIFGEYYHLNLSSAPRVTSVFSPEEALEELKENHFDLVIVMTGPDRNMPIMLSHEIKRFDERMPVLLLLNNNNEISLFTRSKKDLESIDKIFVWNGDSNIFLAMIKYVEDWRNAENDVFRGDVNIILLVEDSVRYYSRYLPILYTVLMQQTQRLILDEDVDERYKILRMRARPKVLMAETYEEAKKLFDKYQNHVLCVISDVKYLKEEVVDEQAGIKLIRELKQLCSSPMLLQSSDTGNAQKAYKLGASFIHKHSATLGRDLKQFFVDNLGFGHFTFRYESGNVIAEAHNMKEFEVLINNVPDETLLYHGSRDDFSTWFMARGEIRAAKKLKRLKTKDFNSFDEMRNIITRFIQAGRKERRSDTIAAFSDTIFKDETFLMRLENGSMGGKGRGLAFSHYILEKAHFENIVDGINIRVPRTAIIGTDEFERFMERISYKEVLLIEDNHMKIKELFLNTPLSDKLVKRIREYLRHIEAPLAVRSSGLFEDSLSKPFAGIYETYFLPNSHKKLEVRLQQVLDAVRLVFCSVYAPLARSYFESVNYNIEEEKMAVIIQELVGNRYGDHFYPHISGVGQSYNFYPYSYMKPEDGLGLLAVGLGKAVVEGEQVYRFSPKYPKTKMLNTEALLENAQREFYALDLKDSDLNLIEGEDATLLRLPVGQAEKDGTLEYSASVFDAAANILRPGLHAKGPRLVNFSYILDYNKIPLSKSITEVLDIMKAALGTAVEIEFSVDISDKNNPVLYLLQVKPLVRNSANFSIDPADVVKDDIFLYTTQGMGNGIVEEIWDIVYVEPETFDKFKTVQMAREIKDINMKLKKEGRQFVLIGPGRWGSSDHLLGIPVDWSAISNAKIIVEAGLENFIVDASLGSHFFHNITSMDIGYFTVSPFSTTDFIDWEWIHKQKPTHTTYYIHHIHLKEPVTVKMDGRKTISLITKKKDAPVVED